MFWPIRVVVRLDHPELFQVDIKLLVLGFRVGFRVSGLGFKLMSFLVKFFSRSPFFFLKLFLVV